VSYARCGRLVISKGSKGCHQTNNGILAESDSELASGGQLPRHNALRFWGSSQGLAPQGIRASVSAIEDLLAFVDGFPMPGNSDVRVASLLQCVKENEDAIEEAYGLEDTPRRAINSAGEGALAVTRRPTRHWRWLRSSTTWAARECAGPDTPDGVNRPISPIAV